MFERHVVPKCDLIQACEWLLYGWEPVLKAEEPYCDQRNRNPNYKESFEYHKAGRALFAALIKKVFKLYTKLDYDGVFLEDLVGKDGDTIEQIKKYFTLESDTDYFKFLSYVMTAFAYDNLYFKTEDLHTHLNPGNWETFENPKYRLEFTNDSSIVLHKPDNTMLVVKTFHSGTTRNFIKLLFDNPNRSYSRDTLRELFKNSTLRPDNIIHDLKESIKDTINQHEQDETVKTNAITFIENSFVYDIQQAKYVKNESENGI